MEKLPSSPKKSALQTLFRYTLWSTSIRHLTGFADATVVKIVREAAIVMSLNIEFFPFMFIGYAHGYK